MKIVLLQQDIHWADVEANIRQANDAVDAHPGGDLYVLPEMFSTGFATEPEGIAESDDGETLRWMKRKAAATDAALCGSIAVKSGTAYYNRFYFVYPDGAVAWYDKRHLFSFGGEDAVFTPGQKRVVVSFRGVRILLLVCYDLRFPVWSRNLGDYDLMLYVANWPEARIGVWRTLLQARAIENQCYVAGVNRVGRDQVCDYPGHSMFVGPYGKVLAECKENSVDGVVGELDLVRLNTFRRKFPVLADADTFEIR